MSGVNPTQSGRNAARAHREGQKAGKNGSAAPVSRPAPVAAPAVKPTVAAKSPVRRQVAPAAPAAVAASAAGREAAKQMRQQHKSGKTSTQGNNQPHPNPKAKARMEKKMEMIQPREKTEVKAAPKRSTDRKVKPESVVPTNPGRNASKAWRQAGATGKAGQAAFKSKGLQSGAVAKMANPGASTRDIAKTIRAERCAKGKQGCAPVKPSGPKRRQPQESSGAPAKVGETSTLSGQSVTGTLVGQGRKVMTGAETGACKLVSGTEYLGAEEFSGSCDTQPTPQPSKVTQTQTTRGQVVSGTEVGNSEGVTGDQAGQCSAVTGTEYIPADQSQIFCGGDAKVNTAQQAFSIMSQPSQQGKTSNVTGGEGYQSQSTTIRPQSAPQKVVALATAMGNMTTGTQVGRLEAVTGTESGSCKSVTGTGYQSAEEAEVCQTQPAPTATKVTASATSRGQVVTGDRSGGNFDTTGAEAGACQPVTGSSYMGAEQAATCSTEQATAIQQRQRQGYNPSISGVQPGPVGLTGAQKGACTLVSGSHYQGNDQTAMICDTAFAAQPGQSDFPQMIGQQQPVMQAAPVATPAPAEVNTGTAITGDGWDRSNKVTGTEGPWASQRNASVRGANGQSPMGASQFRPVAMEEVPQSPITGSAGNTTVGAKVTLSGGARA